MRKQHHLRPSPAGLLAWDVHRLIRLAAHLPRIEVPLEAIRELDEPFWFGGGSNEATCRAVGPCTSGRPPPTYPAAIPT
ncbi:MAG: hypothetical protein ICV87_10995 [Gemmatimonadetes bacterium]|nr:hypothetical protein [Gemmatimonadota bacterium]